MAFKIPEIEQATLARVLRLPEETWAALLDAIKQVAPTVLMGAYAARVSSAAQGKIEGTEELIRFLGNLYSVREQSESTTDDFLEDLRKAGKEAGPETDPEIVDWTRFEERLATLLSEESSFALTAKAGALFYEQERLLTDARIITDLRPLFRSEVEKRPAAMLVTHTLRLAFHESGRWKEAYISLDVDDLKSLQTTVGRALKKDSSLKSLLVESGIPCLGTDSDEGT